MDVKTVINSCDKNRDDRIDREEWHERMTEVYFFLNGYMFVGVDIVGRKLINIIELNPSVIGKEGSARRNKEHAALFDAASS